MRTVVLCGLTLMLLSGCFRGVRQEDLNAWVGQPVSLLDQHPFFMTVPLERRFTADGVEIRNYRNGRTYSDCSVSAGYFGSDVDCYQNDVVCNNIFYIKNNKVIRYEPTGRCYTKASLQPQRMY